MIEATIIKNVHSESEESFISDKRIVTLVYVLQALSFFLGFTFIIAVIITYVKQKSVEGTWLESHFKWQRRTFWFGLLWSILGLISILIVVGYFILLVNTGWMIYRVAKGWLRFNEGKEMYVINKR